MLQHKTDLTSLHNERCLTCQIYSGWHLSLTHSWKHDIWLSYCWQYKIFIQIHCWAQKLMCKWESNVQIRICNLIFAMLCNMRFGELICPEMWEYTCSSLMRRWDFINQCERNSQNIICCCEFDSGRCTDKIENKDLNAINM